jgi:hypothetical protein
MTSEKTGARTTAGPSTAPFAKCADGFAQDDRFLGFTDYFGARARARARARAKAKAKATAKATANANANATANAGILRCAQNDGFRGKALGMTASGESVRSDDFGSGEHLSPHDGYSEASLARA